MDINIPFYKMSKAQKTQLYMDNLTVIFNPQALFSDGTAFYRNPSEPDCFEEVHLRFRTGRENVDEVILVFDEQRYTMQKVANDKMFDYYEYTVKLGDSRVEYYFEVHSGHMVCYFNSVGVCSSVENYYNFSITPSFQTPDWAKGAIIYQIFVDRFYNGDRSNDVETDEYFYIGEGTHKNSDWMKYPREMDVREFYGGDIAGVMQKLDYLQDLGVEAIYLNPIFVSPSNHKYDIQDYDYIDPHFGRIVKNDGENLQRDENGNLIIHDPEHPNKDATRYICRVTDKENLEASNQLFIEFVEEVHRRGMKVILDGVFNHCGSFNKWLDRECIYEDAPGYEKVLSYQKTAHTAHSLSSARIRGRTMLIMTAGGDTIHCQSSIMRNPQSCMNILCGSHANGFHHLIMLMDGVWMWQQIWGRPQSTTIISGTNSAVM